MLPIFIMGSFHGVSKTQALSDMVAKSVLEHTDKTQDVRSARNLFSLLFNDCQLYIDFEERVDDGVRPFNNHI